MCNQNSKPTTIAMIGTRTQQPLQYKGASHLMDGAPATHPATPIEVSNRASVPSPAKVDPLTPFCSSLLPFRYFEGKKKEGKRGSLDRRSGGVRVQVQAGG